MEFLKTIGKAVGEAAAHLGEKNHRAAQLSRIRSFLRCQEKAAEKEYLALGRYYYHNLRDKEDVQAFDQDPAAQEETPAQAAPAPVEAAPAEEAPAATPAPAEENENLPFEG